MQLPVTTEEARAGGVEIYGYPKFVAEIDFHLDGNFFSGVTRENKSDKEIVRLEGSARFGVPVPGMDVQTWSLRGASLLKTQIKMDSTLRVSPGRGFRLSVGPPIHPMAKQLREPGLDGAVPFRVARSDSYRSVLPLGEVVD